MDLTVKKFKVDSVSWGDATVYENHHLTINKKELEELINGDPSFHDVELELVRPGEKTRIVNILDVLDARCKAEGEGAVYPGMFNKLGIGGIGTTHVLDGLLIAQIGDVRGKDSFKHFITGILDMEGPAADISNYSKKNVLVLNMLPNTDSTKLYDNAIVNASIKVSMYLAKATLNQEPDATKQYSLEKKAESDKPLPRVTFVYITENHEETKFSYIYGSDPNYFLPFYLHPNEIMDGCMVGMSYTYPPSLRNYTYNIINNPIIQELYEHHGKDLDFVGVVISNAQLSPMDKHKTSVVLAKTAKYDLHSDGVIITREGGGHPEVDQMLCCEQCEKLGVKTCLVDTELLSGDGSGSPLVYFAEHSDCIISSGNHEQSIALPKMEKLIGYRQEDEDFRTAWIGEMNISVGRIANALSEVGNSTLYAAAY